MRRRPRLGLLIFAASTAAGLYFATKLYLSHPAAVRKSWPYSVAVNLANYWAWGAAVPAVVALGRRFPLGSKRWLMSLPVHLAAGVFLGSLGVLVPALTLSWLHIYAHPPTFELMRRMIRLNFHSSFEMYWLILLAYVAVDYQRRYKERELGAAQLQGRLTAARLEALRMQLNPHFLFNALNSISSLMYVDAQTADTMIRKLGDLLRFSLDRRRGDEITLRDEIDFLQHYLDIERLRLEDRLRVRLDVEPEALPAMVPTFVLQPLVENALRHAIAPRPDGGSVEISVVAIRAGCGSSWPMTGRGCPRVASPRGWGWPTPASDLISSTALPTLSV